MVLLGPAVFMPRVPATGGTNMTGLSATNWSQRGGHKNFGLWWRWPERMGGLNAGYGMSQSLCCQILGQACCASWKPAIGGTGVNETSEEVSAGGWSRTASCNICTLHLPLQQVKCLYLTQNGGVMGFVCLILQKASRLMSQWVNSPWSSNEYQIQGSVLAVRGDCETSGNSVLFHSNSSQGIS